MFYFVNCNNVYTMQFLKPYYYYAYFHLLNLFTQSFHFFGIYIKEEKGFQYTTIFPIF